MSKATYLVTGGAGFIGSNFILYMFKKYGDRIAIINMDKLTYAGNLENLKAIESLQNYSFVHGDICDEQAVAAIFAANEINYVVNFAAESHVDRSITNPKIFAITNVLGTLNLLNCAKASWADSCGDFFSGVKYLQVSTDEVYGSLGAEGFFTEDTPICPHSPYSASKAAADMFCMAYFDTYKMPINITRCSNNYGPYQFPEKLIPLMINNATQAKDLPVYGDGLQIRDWLYVEDHCRAIDLVLNDSKAGEIYNIGGHNERTNLFIINNIVQYLSDQYKCAIDSSLIKHIKDRKGHDRRYGIDPRKIQADLGWQPEVFFDEGIKMTIDWYINNRAWIDNVTSGDYATYYEKAYGKKL